MDIAGQRALILGLAREGVSLARFLSKQGALVTVTDSASPGQLKDRQHQAAGTARFVLGGDHPELVDGADLFFVSPGVPEENAVYRAAIDRGLPVESMTTLFFALCPAPIVGITGSSGKTTTTGLIGHMVRSEGLDCVVGGNIGAPMLDLLPQIGPRTNVILELSSFQLGLLRRSPHIAVVTNISPNHLDRHGSMEGYLSAKRHIIRYQVEADVAVLNAADSEVAAWRRHTPAQLRWFGETGVRGAGATVRDGQAGLLKGERFEAILPVADVPLLGAHNRENVLAALATADLLGVAPAAMTAALRTFQPAAHRLQTVGEYGGVRYVNDSIATSPARAQVALQAMSAPVVLIAGGRNKRLPWTGFAQQVVHTARSLILIGETGPQIEEAVRGFLDQPGALLCPDAIYQCASLHQAVVQASRVARTGDVVLLAPACASYDMFSNFEERGESFTRAVELLSAA